MPKPILVAASLLLSLAASSAMSQEMTLLFHNGSRTLFTKSEKGQVEIRYETPRPGLPVTEGALLFSGRADANGSYTGTAYTFKRGCEPAPYSVAGKEAGPGIILVGIAPRRDHSSCAIVGDTLVGKHTKLIFEYEMEEPDPSVPFGSKAAVTRQ